MLASNLYRRNIYVVCVGIAITFLLFSHFSFDRYSDPSGAALEGKSSLPQSRLCAAWLTPCAAVVLQVPAAKEVQEPTPLTAKPFPEKIWQSWKDDSENPTERTVGFPHQWRAVNPTWRYERLTDDNGDSYVRNSYSPEISGLFSNITDRVLKADFLRYLIMLGEGGVWADIDVSPQQPISKWVPEEYKGSANLVVGIENDHHKRPIWNGVPYSVQLAQYTMLAKPNHPVFITLVKQVAGNLKKLLGSKALGDGISFEDVMANTGPFAFTKVLMDYFTKVSGVKHTGDELSRLEEPKLIGDVLVLPKDAFGWLAHEQTLEKGDPKILVQHLFIGSWREGHPG
ncbi:putative Nucleotide-diphospho-sugar transferase [Seiridium unicorne]|uniref:Nucleotide-diphospho-sugar transferase n=1 Tax=Seiridium unicorne TaxID=138068 RepID=A0ABR2UV07_9PEZI